MSSTSHQNAMIHVYIANASKNQKKNKNQANLKVRSHSKKRFDRDVGLLDINDFGCQNIHNKWYQVQKRNSSEINDKDNKNRRKYIYI